MPFFPIKQDATQVLVDGFHKVVMGAVGEAVCVDCIDLFHDVMNLDICNRFMCRKKISCRLGASRSIGKSPAAGKVFSEASESLPPPGKCFPKHRKVSRRRKSASRGFGKCPATGKILPLAAKYTI